MRKDPFFYAFFFLKMLECVLSSFIVELMEKRGKLGLVEEKSTEEFLRNM